MRFNWLVGIPMVAISLKAVALQEREQGSAC
jgi:hypothetical protein